MKLAKRTPRFSADARKDSPKLRGFHLPQREHVKRPMPPRGKP